MNPKRGKAFFVSATTWLKLSEILTFLDSIYSRLDHAHVLVITDTVHSSVAAYHIFSELFWFAKDNGFTGNLTCLLGTISVAHCRTDKLDTGWKEIIYNADKTVCNNLTSKQSKPKSRSITGAHAQLVGEAISALICITDRFEVQYQQIFAIPHFVLHYIVMLIIWDVW